jgi:hypothetical protein
MTLGRRSGHDWASRIGLEGDRLPVTHPGDVIEALGG